MKSEDILAHNHDSHFHSQEFSDGSHPAVDVARYVARWQEHPRWVGLCDHSPKEEDQIRNYRRDLGAIQKRLFEQDGIMLLAGMELEWKPSGPVIAGGALAELDYVLASYHGMSFSTANQVEKYFELVAQYPYSDGVAHPDRFLGSVDALTIDWESIFKNLKSHEVWCDYNLTMPLRPEILDIAINRTQVNFMIASDTHDYHDIAVRRVIDAWSESLAGGYSLAKAYLLDLLKMVCSPQEVARLSELFATRALLIALQDKLYLRSLDSNRENIILLPDEELLLSALAKIPEGAVDQEFLTRRLDRFTSLPPERIPSLLAVEAFKELVKHGRQKR
jgi:histidinol phosphatase-like PHP family hydrolase